MSSSVWHGSTHTQNCKERSFWSDRKPKPLPLKNQQCMNKVNDPGCGKMKIHLILPCMGWYISRSISWFYVHRECVSMEDLLTPDFVLVIDLSYSIKYF